MFLIFNQIKLEFVMSRGWVNLNISFHIISGYTNCKVQMICFVTEVSSEQALLDGIVQPLCLDVLSQVKLLYLIYHCIKYLCCLKLLIIICIFVFCHSDTKCFTKCSHPFPNNFFLPKNLQFYTQLVIEAEERLSEGIITKFFFFTDTIEIQ